MKSIEHYYTVLIEELNGWVEAIVAALPNAVIALIVVIVFCALAVLIKNLVERGLRRFSDSVTLAQLAGTTAKTIVIVLGLILALGILGLQKAVFSLLAGAGVIGLALGFAFQDLAANFIAGVFMAFRKPFRPGDVIQTVDFIGVVSDMNMRNTLIETFDGQLVVIPNKSVFENPLINYSYLGKRRIQLEVGVAYDTDLPKAAEVIKRAIESLDFLSKGKDVLAVGKVFGGSSINFNVYYWIDFPNGKNYLEAISEGVIVIKKAFDDEGINIPFPIRTLDFSLAQQQPLIANVEKVAAN